MTLILLLILNYLLKCYLFIYQIKGYSFPHPIFKTPPKKNKKQQLSNETSHKQVDNIKQQYTISKDLLVKLQSTKKRLQQVQDQFEKSLIISEMRLKCKFQQLVFAQWQLHNIRSCFLCVVSNQSKIALFEVKQQEQNTSNQLFQQHSKIYQQISQVTNFKNNFLNYQNECKISELRNEQNNNLPVNNNLLQNVDFNQFSIQKLEQQNIMRKNHNFTLNLLKIKKVTYKYLYQLQYLTKFKGIVNNLQQKFVQLNRTLGKQLQLNKAKNIVNHLADMYIRCGNQPIQIKILKMIKQTTNQLDINLRDKILLRSQSYAMSQFYTYQDIQNGLYIPEKIIVLSRINQEMVDLTYLLSKVQKVLIIVLLCNQNQQDENVEQYQKYLGFKYFTEDFLYVQHLNENCGIHFSSNKNLSTIYLHSFTFNKIDDCQPNGSFYEYFSKLYYVGQLDKCVSKFNNVAQNEQCKSIFNSYFDLQNNGIEVFSQQALILQEYMFQFLQKNQYQLQKNLQNSSSQLQIIFGAGPPLLVSLAFDSLLKHKNISIPILKNQLYKTLNYLNSNIQHQEVSNFKMGYRIYDLGYIKWLFEECFKIKFNQLDIFYVQNYDKYVNELKYANQNKQIKITQITDQIIHLQKTLEQVQNKFNEVNWQQDKQQERDNLQQLINNINQQIQFCNLEIEWQNNPDNNLGVRSPFNEVEMQKKMTQIKNGEVVDINYAVIFINIERSFKLANKDVFLNGEVKKAFQQYDSYNNLK